MNGLDYTKTFSFVAKIYTIKKLLALTASQDWTLHQLDINNAFLHGNINEEFDMKPPKGLTLPYPDNIYRLKKVSTT